MDSESASDTVFKEYRNLEPTSRSLEQYLVLFSHLAAGLTVSAIQFRDGLSAWLVGFGIVTPILLIIHGVLYSMLPDVSWVREQMVPFMSSIVTTTEIETDRFLQYHQRLNRLVLILGWPTILVCQIAWSFGLTRIMPAFVGDDLLTRLLGELIGYAVIFGPFLLFPLLLFLIGPILERSLQTRYEDIRHLLEIEGKWNMENSRRTKDPESVKKQNDATDRQWF